MAVSAQNSVKGKYAGRNAGIAAVLVVAAGVLVACLAMARRAEPPIIQGVRGEIIVYEDEDVRAALLDGVTAVDAQNEEAFPVAVAIYYRETGEEAKILTPGTYGLRYSSSNAGAEAQPLESILTILPVDREAPVISGVQDMTVEMGDTVSYRSGVTVTDNVDPSVQLRIDAGQVDLTTPGEYTVVYSAVDSHGNKASATATVLVEPPKVEEALDDKDRPTERTGAEAVSVTEDDIYALADRILGEITPSGMSQREKARAIFNYVHGKIRYVGTSDKSNWLSGAYVGLTRGRGDCYNYFAASKLLLTQAGIPNVDLVRTGGNTDHYWQLVDVGEGYYHFDACPHPNGYPITSFLLTEAEVRDYSERCKSVRKNYYIYDYESCPVAVVGTPVDTAPPAETQAPAAELPAETVVPLPTEAVTPAETTAPVETPPLETEIPEATEGELTAGIPFPAESGLPAGTVPPAETAPAEP